MTQEIHRPPESAAEGQRPIDPEKLLRLASLAREVLEEARKMEATEATVAELAGLHTRVTKQLYEALPETLVNELEEIDLDVSFDESVSGQEVRLAYSGLIGWLGGLFQGLQAAMHFQTLAQLQQQRALEPGQEEEEKEEKSPPGRYL
jgi:hypothetical protein